MRRTLIAATMFVASSPICALEFQGEIGVQHRYFSGEGALGQKQNQTSVFVEPEIFWESDEIDLTFSLKPFYRYDALDDERTHADIREALFSYYSENYEFKAGVGKVFWGVTESQHLVDVINQSDFIESIDGEVKLGQPMLSVGAETDNGMWEIFVLPYFRERTYAGPDGRLSLPVFSEHHVTYESSNEEKHTDVAFRYATSLDDVDVGLSAFHGTNRDPFLQQAVINGKGALALHYAQMTQVALDAQAIAGSWLWKLEAIHRDSLENHVAATAGFEYSLVTESGYDVGLLAEYLYDDREGMTQQIGQNDVFAGVRLALNDIDGTEFLVGGTVDLETSDSTTLRVEASGRINNDVSWNLTAGAFNSEKVTDPLYQIKKDDYIELGMTYYF